MLLMTICSDRLMHYTPNSVFLDLSALVSHAVKLNVVRFKNKGIFVVITLYGLVIVILRFIFNFVILHICWKMKCCHILVPELC